MATSGRATETASALVFVYDSPDQRGALEASGNDYRNIHRGFYAGGKGGKLALEIRRLRSRPYLAVEPAGRPVAQQQVIQKSFATLRNHGVVG